VTLGLSLNNGLGGALVVPAMIALVGRSSAWAIGKALPSLQRRLVPRVYGRGEADTFPVQYRANTPEAIRGVAATAGLEVFELMVVPDPTYLAWNGFMFRASVLAERLLPGGWGVHLVGDLLRRSG